MLNRLAIAIVSGLILYLPASPSSAKNSFAVLAASWQPAFCEQRSDRPECATQTSTRYDASNFALHGLWPGPRSRVYCDIPAPLMAIDKSGRWGKLPDLRLPPRLLSRLNQIMPGTKSFLQRHEWVKHGSCHENGSAEGYFADSLRLMNQLNESSVRQLFADNIGKYVGTETIRATFVKSFGRDAGERVKVSCKRDGRRLIISEITIGLYGEFDENASMARLIGAARPTGPGCKGGIVDPAGLQ